MLRFTKQLCALQFRECSITLLPTVSALVSACIEEFGVRKIATMYADKSIDSARI